ncbi:PolC-type DNA polymerase III [Bacillus dakarensis]|uniref:3'-5' exonuclease n=1 Tax=Robertmurraya dakarensis TaxID=1926278 RepID=UPI0009815059|nr:3'-5' exonuclease [Bacillus dakarensis]
MFFQRKKISCGLQYNTIPLSTPLAELRYTVFDTETTGFQVGTTDRLIEIGAVQVMGFEVLEEGIFQTFVNPKRQISREITELTSITGEKVRDAPPAHEAILSFIDYVQSWNTVCLVGHYVSFDSLAIKSELKREKVQLKDWFTIDTLDLIGYIAPSYDMRDLEKYARIFGTRMYDRHSAVGDALTTAYLFVELLWQFKNRGYDTWGELINATDNSARSLFL